MVDLYTTKNGHVEFCLTTVSLGGACVSTLYLSGFCLGTLAFFHHSKTTSFRKIVKSEFLSVHVSVTALQITLCGVYPTYGPQLN